MLNYVTVMFIFVNISTVRAVVNYYSFVRYKTTNGLYGGIPWFILTGLIEFMMSAMLQNYLFSNLKL